MRVRPVGEPRLDDRRPIFPARRGNLYVQCLISLAIGLATTTAVGWPLTQPAVAAPGTAKADSGTPPPTPAPTATCETANELRDEGRIAQAEQAYLEALKTPEGLECAPTELAGLPPSAFCEAGLVLEQRGFEDEAKTAYVERLKAAPESECAAAGLERLDDTWFWDGEFFDDLKAITDDALAGLGFVAAVAALLFLVLILIATLMARSRLLQEWPPALWFVRPTIAIGPFGDEVNDPKLGPGLAAFVRTEVQSGRGDTQLTHLAPGMLTTADAWASRLEAVGDQAKTVGALVDLALSTLPRRNFVAGGELQRSQQMGPGVSLTLTRDNAFVDGVHLWAGDLELPTDPNDDDRADVVRQLAIPAAAWISHRSLIASRNPPAEAEDPMSWALYQAGLDFDRRQERLEAWKLVTRSLELDPTNYAARIYMGIFYLNLGQYPTALFQLREALRLIKR